jgi:hypothetical protein
MILSLLTFAKIEAMEISLILLSHFTIVSTFIHKSLSNQNLLFQSIINSISSQVSFCHFSISFLVTWVVPLFKEGARRAGDFFNISNIPLLIAKFKAFVIPSLSISVLLTLAIANNIFQSFCKFSIFRNNCSLCFSLSFLLSSKQDLLNFFNGKTIPICIGQANGHLPASSIYNFIVIKN